MIHRTVSSSSLYPISNLEASLAASSAQGTAIAIRYKEGIVLIAMSPKEQNPTSKDEISENDIDYFIPMTSRGNTISKSLKILQEKYGLAMSITGFASDCNYVTRYAAGAISEHEFIYGGEILSCQSLVRDTLAPLLREKTMGNGNRPLGIQAMVIGGEKIDSISSDKQTIATLDPIGNARYWTQHAVIGKHSEIVKKYLSKVSNDTSHPQQQISNWEDALQLGLSAMLDGIQVSKNIHDMSTEEIIKDVDCFIFWNQASSSLGKCASIKRARVSKILCACIEERNKAKEHF